MGNEPINPFEEEIKATEAEANAIGEEVRLLQQETAFDNTRKAMEEANKGWRQMLIDSHKKREAERTKRLRSEQIVGLGKALGDLLGAAFAGAGSVRGDYAAVVPQAQAPKSAERIHQLINEGVVNAKDYDNMLQSLAMQEGKERVALAKAQDELDIKKLDAIAKEAQAQRDHQRKLEIVQLQSAARTELENLKGTIAAAKLAAKAKDDEALARLKGQITMQIHKMGGVRGLDLDYFTMESLDELFPEETEYTTRTTGTDSYGLPTSSTVVGTRRNPRGSAQMQAVSKENKRFANAVGLKADEIAHISRLRQYGKANNFTEAQLKAFIAQARKEGMSVADFLDKYDPQ